MSTRPAHTSRSLWLPLLLIGLGIGLRILRLEWQPLWWDEGYSVYFATESLAEMARLTAQDIHPPLYYALLHFWLLLWGAASPLALRSFSVLIGLLSLPAIWWLARTLAPRRVRAARLALLLLALSPMHIFYSQEVRMYGLEMLLGVVSTGLFRRLVGSARSGADTRQKRPIGLWLGYVAATTALLYTEYYAALLPLAHGLWAVWRFRATLRRLLPLVAAWLAVALAFLPWLLYAVPELIPYISQKVVEDADRPLGLGLYALRHLVAFTSGHIVPETSGPTTLVWLALSGLLLLLLSRAAVHWTGQKSSPTAPVPSPGAVTGTGVYSFLLLLLLVPFAAGFLLNLRLPFFPEGGERVLLFILPYFLLLLSLSLSDLLAAAPFWSRRVAAVGLLALLLGGAGGVWNFYTVPRYGEEDYRPLIRQAVEQGSETDTVLAVFPWQMGYWRAYAPVWGRGALHGPWPRLSPSAAWDGSVQQAIDDALAQGKLWFPAHLSLGGILESEIEGYLAGRPAANPGQVTVNFENRWYSPSTRLSGWAEAADPDLTAGGGDFGAVRLERGGVGAREAASANEVVAVALDWSRLEAQELQVTLRLVDADGWVWAQRDYAPLGSWPLPGPGPADRERVGLLVPAGLPPGEYWVAVGVGPADAEWLYPATDGAETVRIGSLAVRLPSASLPALRLPVQNRLSTPATREGVQFLGASGFETAVPTLAGAQMRISLFVRTPQPPSRAWDVYVAVLDSDGNGVGGWEGWPLPGYPLPSWPPAAQMRLPLSFYLPATLSPGDYRVVAGLRDPESGQKGPAVALGSLPITRRAVSFAAVTPQTTPAQPPLFGSHVTLIGYDLNADAPEDIALTLYWRVEQTLLPPHHVFVHLRDENGARLAQDDGVPGRLETAAPSNTWIPGEIIVDPHRIRALGSFDGTAEIRVGLYTPAGGVRLPVSVDGVTTGDAFTIPLP